MPTTPKKIFTMGVSQILFGAIAADGGMGTTLAPVGYTNQDSCTVTMDDPDVTEFYAEEVDMPVVTKSKKGKVTIALSVMNPSIETLAMFLGGTADTDNLEWNNGTTYENIELSCRIIPDQGFIFDIPRLKIDAKINGNLNNSSILTLDITGTVLQPEKEGVPNLKLRETLPVATPTFTPSSWDSGSTLSVSLATTTPGATIYYTTDGATPTSASTAYSTAISLSATTTIKAVAIKDGISSEIASKSYTKPGA